MSRGIFITGTGTDIGKTFVSALIVKKLHEAGMNAAYFKAAVSENERDSKGELIPGDAAYVRKISGISQPLGEMCPYVYERAYSPHLAAICEGDPVDMDVVAGRFADISSRYDYVTMEGSGGITCPIRYDSSGCFMLTDMISQLGLSCIVVADAGLGTINNTVLTCEYMKARDIPIKGIIYNRFRSSYIMHTDNVKMCEELTGVKTVALVPEDADDLYISADELAELYEVIE
ncbi:MAG: dethiobiotin synthase [Ruminococcus sp.]|nr:dethiobiotin synthase [Ruminococcus sp.]